MSDECASHQGTCPTPLALMQSRIDRLLVEWEAEGRPMWCRMAAYDLRAALQMGEVATRATGHLSRADRGDVGANATDGIQGRDKGANR